MFPKMVPHRANEPEDLPDRPNSRVEGANDLSLVLDLSIIKTGIGKGQKSDDEPEGATPRGIAATPKKRDVGEMAEDHRTRFYALYNHSVPVIVGRRTKHVSQEKYEQMKEDIENEGSDDYDIIDDQIQEMATCRIFAPPDQIFHILNKVYREDDFHGSKFLYETLKADYCNITFKMVDMFVNSLPEKPIYDRSTKSYSVPTKLGRSRLPYLSASDSEVDSPIAKISGTAAQGHRRTAVAHTPGRRSKSKGRTGTVSKMKPFQRRMMEHEHPETRSVGVGVHTRLMVAGTQTEDPLPA